MAITTPPGWGIQKLTEAFQTVGSAEAAAYWPNAGVAHTVAVRNIGLRDLRYALARGFEDFLAYRTDVLFLCLVYPVVGLLMARVAFGSDLLPLLFPLASGFALIGPFAAVGLNEMSRRREMGMPSSWVAGFGVFRSPAIVSVMILGTVLIALFVAWMVAAWVIYSVTLGPAMPPSTDQFVHAVLHTGAGHAMIVLGVGVGFVMAVVVLTISVVSFPMLLDRNVSVETAIRTSVEAVRANMPIMAVWGAIIAGGLVLGSIPALLGLVIVMPVLGHATWHLYRRMIRM
jgi:uncharacterized membrane protein